MSYSEYTIDDLILALMKATTEIEVSLIATEMEKRKK